ncbi:hypothetical protein EIP91_005964, partial [Steccherinum ochraceum]
MPDPEPGPGGAPQQDVTVKDIAELKQTVDAADGLFAAIDLELAHVLDRATASAILPPFRSKFLPAVQELRSRWHSCHKQYRDCVWSSRETAGTAQGFLSDFVEVGLKTLDECKGLSLDERREILQSYRNAIDARASEAEKMTGEFEALCVEVNKCAESWANTMTRSNLTKLLRNETISANMKTLSSILGESAVINLVVQGVSFVLMVLSSTWRHLRGLFLPDDHEAANEPEESSKLQDLPVSLVAKISVICAVWAAITVDLQNAVELLRDSESAQLFTKRLAEAKTVYIALIEALREYQVDVVETKYYWLEKAGSDDPTLLLIACFMRGIRGSVVLGSQQAISTDIKGMGHNIKKVDLLFGLVLSELQQISDGLEGTSGMTEVKETVDTVKPALELLHEVFKQLVHDTRRIAGHVRSRFLDYIHVIFPLINSTSEPQEDLDLDMQNLEILAVREGFQFLYQHIYRVSLRCEALPHQLSKDISEKHWRNLSEYLAQLKAHAAKLPDVVVTCLSSPPSEDVVIELIVKAVPIVLAFGSDTGRLAFNAWKAFVLSRKLGFVKHETRQEQLTEMTHAMDQTRQTWQGVSEAVDSLKRILPVATAQDEFEGLHWTKIN